MRLELRQALCLPSDSRSGASYTGELEEFLNGSPLPLTDVVINPKDGAMYFTIGGRNTMSGLYRVTYVGKEKTEPEPWTKAKGEGPSHPHQPSRYTAAHPS